MHERIVPAKMIFHPLKYYRRWLRMYRQWEFWALTTLTISAYFLLQSYGLLPDYFRHHQNVLKIITTAIITLPMPYLIAKKERRLNGGDDWFMRLFRAFQQPGTMLPKVIGSLVLLSTACFFLPIFNDVQSKRPLSGLGLILQQPIVALIPFLYLISATLIIFRYKGWRLSAFFWIFGAYIGTFSAAGLYTNTMVDTAPSFLWASLIVEILPLVAAGLCLLPQRVGIRNEP